MEAELVGGRWSSTCTQSTASDSSRTSSLAAGGEETRRRGRGWPRSTRDEWACSRRMGCRSGQGWSGSVLAMGGSSLLTFGSAVQSFSDRGTPLSAGCRHLHLRADLRRGVAPSASPGRHAHSVGLNNTLIIGARGGHRELCNFICDLCFVLLALCYLLAVLVSERDIVLHLCCSREEQKLGHSSSVFP